MIEAPLCPSPIPSASVSLPGPEQSSHRSARPRRRAIASIPPVGSSARISTAAALPAGSQTKLSRLWIP